MDAERSLSSHNIAFLEAIYEQYEQDPDSVSPDWRALIEYERGRNGAAPNGHSGGVLLERRNGVAEHVPADVEQVMLQKQVDRLIENYRLIGHLRADIDPLERPRPAVREGLDLDYFRLTEAHLDREFSAGRLFEGNQLVKLRDIVEKLQRIYCRRIGVEYWDLHDVSMRSWLRERMESTENVVVPSRDEQLDLWRSLARCDEIDNFLHTKFLGAKRFSIAGAESVLALLHTLIEAGGAQGVEEVLMGMAHRGRLAVMMNIFGQTPAQIFEKFEGGDPWAQLGTGDVKYHLGCYRDYTTREGRDMYLALAFNPSHLEAITPVIAGRVRASQDKRPAGEETKVLGVTMHGDAAVMGQGVYAETLNLGRLQGYGNKGTIRVVINNQVGFTTDPHDSRSTVYPTAVADMLNAPVFHVNGDDPEAAAYAAKLAVEYRQKFETDVIIDLVCYRKFGHNEGDEPTFTQPDMYRLIKGRKSVRERYEQRLLERGTITQKDLDDERKALHAEFEEALAAVRKSSNDGPAKSPMHGVWESFAGGPDEEVDEADTAVPAERLDALAEKIVVVPETFKLHRKLQRFVKELGEMARGEAPLSWAAAEHLAYASLLTEGHSVRISGQDAIRGTFTHRHVGWTDNESNVRYFAMQNLAPDQGRFDCFNSPLSEFGVLGFEFGYSLASPNTLLIWEAQFGDFANGAQVIIDQFVSSSEDKWNRISGLVMFLPHGYEGQGPEHSSARLERFLQLCAEDNMQVCNLTSPAQVFHALRRQIHRKWRKPLVVMTPKSLLRTRESFSPREELSSGGFQRLIDDSAVDDKSAKKVRRVMFCSGKVYYDLAKHRDELGRKDVAIVRVEQFYPFPADAAQAAMKRYSKATEVFWVQEEPKNMGGWAFIRPYLEEVIGTLPLKYAGRVPSASPATGSNAAHKLEQDMIMKAAFADLA